MLSTETSAGGSEQIAASALNTAEALPFCSAFTGKYKAFHTLKPFGEAMSTQINLKLEQFVSTVKMAVIRAFNEKMKSSGMTILVGFVLKHAS